MAQFKQVHPVIPARDVTGAIKYYTEKLGFSLAFQDSDSNPRYAGVSRDGVELHIQWHDEGDFNKVERLGLRFLIEDVDSLFNEYEARGVFHSKTALQDTPWGTREFAFYDLNGNGLFFYCNL
jgi:catechol 2,3-dioxygenase-like lactoylglutathione lyase family enzyme